MLDDHYDAFLNSEDQGSRRALMNHKKSNTLSSSVDEGKEEINSSNSHPTSCSIGVSIFQIIISILNIGHTKGPRHYFNPYLSLYPYMGSDSYSGLYMGDYDKMGGMKAGNDGY